MDPSNGSTSGSSNGASAQAGGGRPISDNTIVGGGGGSGNSGAMRPTSAVEALAKSGIQQRPSSDVLTGGAAAGGQHYKSPEAQAIDRWFEDLSYYERTLEQMAHAKLDDNFREELKAIEQWFTVLSDPERTTALYSLLQHTTPVQVRFFMTVLQQMAQKDPTAMTPMTPTTPSANPTSLTAKHSSTPGAIGSPPVVVAANPKGDLLSEGSSSGANRSRFYTRNSDPVVDDAISSANWAVGAGNPPGLSNLFPIGSAAGLRSAGPSPTVATQPGGSIFTAVSPLATDAARQAAGTYSQNKSSRPVSPIFVGNPTPLVPNTPPNVVPAAARGHPGDGWNHVSLGSFKTPGSPAGYAHSEYSDSHDDSMAEYGEDGKLRAGAHKEKGKIPESVDMEALKDIPSWLRSLRLHKYTDAFAGLEWQEMVKLSDADLIKRGVAALGARRKLLKVFELIRTETNI